jgi:predicted nucleic acid-binding Zn ribbon protein
MARNYCEPWTPVNVFLPPVQGVRCNECGKARQTHQAARSATFAVCWECGGWERLAVLLDAARRFIAALQLRS